MSEPDEFKLLLGDSVFSPKGCTYKAIQLLGQGGNATTYLVQCTAGEMWAGLPFALKAYRRISMPERQPRFLFEREFLLTCDHPSVMRVYDAGVHGNNPYFVAEYLPKTLSLVLRERSGTMVEKLMFGAQLLAAINYLGDRGMVHRDIKPDNIFIKGRGCVLGDFGLVKRVDDESDHKLDVELLVETLMPAMPKGFRTPDLIEYSKNKTPLTIKTDIFQLGLVLAKLFTGFNPARTAKNLLDAFEMDAVAPVRGELGPTIRDIIVSMLNSDPNGRPDTMDIIDAWHGIFERACQMTQQIEGSVLP
jgi:serine/threonine protein kinase